MTTSKKSAEEYMFITTINDNREIISSTYWESPMAKAGKILCSTAGNTLRVMLPSFKVLPELLQAVRTSAYSVVSRGAWPAVDVEDAFEIMFEDHTLSPYAVHVTAESFDLLPSEHTKLLTCWLLSNSKPKKVASMTCYFRRVETIPCLEPIQTAPATGVTQ